MYRIHIFIVIAMTALISCLIACSKTRESETGSVSSGGEQSYQSTGVIKKIDLETSMVTIDHEDIPGYMPPMEMTEDVIDVNMLKAFKVGDIVEFDLERNGSELTITNIVRNGFSKDVWTAELYSVNCAECHGAKGEGAEKGIPFTSGHALHHTEVDLIKTVTNGKKSKNKNKDEMPSFKEKLSEEEIADVVKYVREVIQKDAVPEKKENGHHSH